MTSSTLPRWSEVTAVFGGTFDPPHLGHREAVRGLFQIPGVRQVLVVPAASPAHKPRTALSEGRLELIRKTFKSTPQNPFPHDVRIHLCEWDRRAEAPERPSYTFDTLLELRRDFSPLAFVIGTDQLTRLPSWHRFPEILTLCHWIVLQRRETEEARAAAFKILSEWTASGLIRAHGAASAQGGDWQIRSGQPSDSTWLKLVPTDAPALSSTEIRLSLARTGQAPLGSLMPEVEQDLKDQKLYGS